MKVHCNEVEYVLEPNSKIAYADLSGVDLSNLDLSNINLLYANLSRANLENTNLEGAFLRNAILISANLEGAILRNADLTYANLRNANLRNVDLTMTRGLVKVMGVEVGNIYWKRIDYFMCNKGYQFKVGINKLREGEEFISDERIICSYPGFHFASRSWCALHYPERPLEAKIRIPEGARINEPWATDGKASADMIEIIQVFDVATGEDVTEKYK